MRPLGKTCWCWKLGAVVQEPKEGVDTPQEETPNWALGLEVQEGTVPSVPVVTHCCWLRPPVLGCSPCPSPPASLLGPVH